MHRRYHHPVILSFYSALFVVALLTAPFTERAAFAVLLLVLLMLRHQSFRHGALQIRVFLPYLALYCLIGSLFGDPATGHLLWQAPAWHWMNHLGIKKLVLTTGSLQASLKRALTLFTLMEFMVFIGRNLSLEDTTFWLERSFPRLALTLGMVVQFFPTLLNERDRIAALFAVRLRSHTNTHPASFLSRQVSSAQQTATVYRVLLLNALDRSWTFAESLYVRGYGASRRTRYKHVRWHATDTRQLVCLVGVAFCLLSRATVRNWAPTVGISGELIGGIDKVMWLFVFAGLAWQGNIMRGSSGNERH